MTVSPSPAAPARQAPLTIVPVGGCGEVGLNATLFDYLGQSVLLDCGALLGVQNAPGVHKVVPGFEPVFRSDRKLSGVVLTHGHEDHIGALSALLAERDVPIFGTPITCDLVRSRLERDAVVPSEARAQSKRLIEVEPGSTFSVGPFDFEFISVTHSVPGSVAVVMSCPAGRILHTGDFRLDLEPWKGGPTDMARLDALGAEGIDVLMSDSTNAEVPGWGRSEREVIAELERQIAPGQGRVVVTMMGSHIHRMGALAEVAMRLDRKLCIVGRALERNWEIGVNRGLITPDPHVRIMPERMAGVPRKKVLVLATGAQGEWNGGLSKIAGGQDGLLRLQAGERVIFSARTIPGNETTVRRVVNRFARQGVKVIGPDDAPVHTSGHARQDEQRELLRRVRPKQFVPVYGERAMLEAHARTAKDAGIEPRNIFVVEDGQTLFLEQGQLRFGPVEEVSRRPLDGDGRVMDWGDVRDRNRISRSGLVACSVALDRAGRLVADPVITERGLRITPNRRLELVAAVKEALDDPHLISREMIENAARQAILRGLEIGPRRGPEIEVLVVAVDRHLAS